jgi:hypothetical protein
LGICFLRHGFFLPPLRRPRDMGLVHVWAISLFLLCLGGIIGFRTLCNDWLASWNLGSGSLPYRLLSAQDAELLRVPLLLTYFSAYRLYRMINNLSCGLFKKGNGSSRARSTGKGGAKTSHIERTADFKLKNGNFLLFFWSDR